MKEKQNDFFSFFFLLETNYFYFLSFFSKNIQIKTQREQREATELQTQRDQEEQERMQEEQETQAALQEAMDMSKILTTKSNADRLRALLPDEPPKGTKGVTKLKVRMLTGRPITRSFEKTTSIVQVRNWITVEMSDRDNGIANFRLNCNMPKCSFGYGDDLDENATLESTQLHPSAMLYVQDMDS